MRSPRRWLLGAAIVVGVLAIAGLAWARPGGGGSYSGGGGHGGSGGDGDGFGELIFALIRLVFLVPEIGVPLLLLFLGYVAWQAYKKHQNRDWDSGPAAPITRAASLDDLRRFDPDFSQAGFEDFVYRLYSAAHRSRGSRLGVDGVAPYVSEPARAALRAMAPTDAPVHGVIVGALRTIRVSVPADAAAVPAGGAAIPPGECAVVVEFESNVMAGAGSAHHTYFQVERWHFTRAAGVRSKAPAASAILPCPNCGAPWQASATGSQQCASCDQVVDNGRFDWLVARIELLAQDVRPPSLTLDVPERGTDLPTYMQPGFAARWAGLLAEDPALTEAALQGRVAHVFDTLARSWSANDLTEARAVVTAGLYDVFAYWIDAYKQQGLRNVLDKLRITRMVPCRLVRDRWFDALTVRIWGTGLDYVIREPGGDVVKGSRTFERAYSEYWTFVRSAGRRGEARGDRACGNCGAPLDVTAAGACGHCGTHVTLGEFDWVLSKIEQDDSYRG